MVDVVVRLLQLRRSSSATCRLPGDVFSSLMMALSRSICRKILIRCVLIIHGGGTLLDGFLALELREQLHRVNRLPGTLQVVVDERHARRVAEEARYPLKDNLPNLTAAPKSKGSPITTHSRRTPLARPARTAPSWPEAPSRNRSIAARWFGVA